MFTVTHTKTADLGSSHEAIAVFYNGTLKQATDTHPNFSRIVEGYKSGIDPDELIALFDVEATVRQAFAKLSDRVEVKNGQVFFDGDLAEPVIARQILRLLDEGAPVAPLVRFMERLDTNPSQNSRAQAFAWFNNHDFPIDDDGCVIAYKGVESDGYGGYRSLASGTAWVNGEKRTGKIPNAVGDIISMPRSEVADNPAASCSVGLHVGTYGFARAYSHGGAMLEVKVDPGAVVSVPHDAAGEKIRVTRYEVLRVVQSENTSAYAGTEASTLRRTRAQVGDRVIDNEGDTGTIMLDDDGNPYLDYETLSVSLRLYDDELDISSDSFLREIL